MIKNIIFDLGGVVLNIDFKLSTAAFKKLGINDFDKLFSRIIQNNLIKDLEIGKIEPQKFRNELKKLSNLNLSDSEIDFAWNALILDYPLERIKLIQQLSKNYSCFLLSNTNKIHCDAFQEKLRNDHNINGLEELFKKAYFSQDLGMRKPNADIFEYVLKENNLLANETIFIDDSLQNIEAAKNLGLHTLFIDAENGKQLSDYFRNGNFI